MLIRFDDVIFAPLVCLYRGGGVELLKVVFFSVDIRGMVGLIIMDLNFGLNEEES
jgi:hypothetical protein